jgi:glutathione S-transferase
MDIFIEWFNEVWKAPPNAIEAELAREWPDLERVAALSTRLRNWLDVFENLLHGRDHLLSDEFSAADCIAFPFLKFATIRDPRDDEAFHVILEQHQPLGTRHPRLAAWIERVDARPRV